MLYKNADTFYIPAGLGVGGQERAIGLYQE